MAKTKKIPKKKQGKSLFNEHVDAATSIAQRLLLKLKEADVPPNLIHSALGSAWYFFSYSYGLSADEFEEVCCEMMAQYRSLWERENPLHPLK